MSLCLAMGQQFSTMAFVPRATSRMSAHLGRITLLNAPRRRGRSFRLRQLLLGSEPDSAFRHFVTSMPAQVTFGLSGCPTTSTSSIPQILAIMHFAHTRMIFLTLDSHYTALSPSARASMSRVVPPTTHTWAPNLSARRQTHLVRLQSRHRRRRIAATRRTDKNAA